MYIIYKSINYPCTCRPAATMVYKGLPNDFPVPVEGEIVLCADDGFVMRIDNIADYLRQTFEDGVLTLTNVPEPVEPEEPDYPVDPEPTQLDRIEAQVTYTAMMTDTLLEEV